MASRSAGHARKRDAAPATSDGGNAPSRRLGLPQALGLTLASALVWGVAHLWTGRRLTGGLLMGLWAALVVAALIAGTFFQGDLKNLAVQPDRLATIVIGILLVGLVWITVVVRSYQLVQPGSLTVGGRAAGAAAVAVLCFTVAVPVALVAHRTYLYQDALSSIFRAGGADGRPVDSKDPWKGQPRVNVLLLGGDAAANREGVRTDSMTLASVDTKTGDTVLLSLPRNLESFQMPAGPARDRFPYGFTGDGAGTPGLLNEVYQYAEEHPDLMPGVPKNDRGPEMIKSTIGGILGQRVDYYILVDMFGFADIIDAMGGVKVKIPEPIPYGQEGAVLQPGLRTLKGKEALWYGRSRTNSDDYTRMGRQKCLLRAIAQQADPKTVLTKFDKLAAAAKRAISTDIPQELLPALMSLSEKVKDGAQINSLQFVPPLISTGNPDFAEIRRLAAKAVSKQSATASAAPSTTSSASPGSTSSPGRTARPSPGSSGGSPSGKPPGEQAKPVSLAASCPS